MIRVVPNRGPRINTPEKDAFVEILMALIVIVFGLIITIVGVIKDKSNEINKCQATNLFAFNFISVFFKDLESCDI